MKLFSQLLVLGLVAEVTVASSWFSKAVYNKWHETELERWLSDNNIPYPSPADRKDLESLVKDNWHANVASPYASWDAEQLKDYLKTKGAETTDTAAANTDGLVAQVKKYWYETEDKAESAWSSVKDWIFDSWTESQLKAFADYHGIPVPQPRTRDTILEKVRSNYDATAKKAGETAAYPGNWLYQAWSDSDLKEWLDTHGIPAPQPTSRDKLIAAVRRNSRIASLKASDMAASASASAQAASQTLSDQLLDSWSDSQIKQWADENGIRVPQGSKRNELLAIARKHRASLMGDNMSAYAASASKSGASAYGQASASGASAYGQASASGASAYDQASASGASVYGEASASGASAYGAATSKVAQQYAQATDDASLMASDAFDSAINSWSDSRLKAYLDARGIPVPQNGRKDELTAAVRLNAHKAASGYSAWTYDTWTYDNLKAYLSASGNKAAKQAADKAGATREDLMSAAQSYYAQASKSSGTAYASVTSALAAATDAAKDSTFETWSDSDLKAYLDSYGVPVPQGTTSNKLKAYARNQANYFRYGTTTPQGTLWVKLQQGAQWVMDQLSIGAAAGRKQAGYQGQKAADAVKEAATTATNRAQEAAQRAGDRIKEEL